MTNTLQLEEIAIGHLHDEPKLLVEWSPRWGEFVTSIGPAFSRSRPRLAGEAPDTLMPYRGMLKSFSIQFLLLFAAIVMPHQIDRLRPYAAPKVRPYEVIYYSGDELPRTQDLGGAQSGSHRPRRRPGSASPHPDHSRGSGQLADAASRRRSQPETSFFLDRSRQLACR